MFLHQTFGSVLLVEIMLTFISPSLFLSHTRLMFLYMVTSINLKVNCEKFLQSECGYKSIFFFLIILYVCKGYNLVQSC